MQVLTTAPFSPHRYALGLAATRRLSAHSSGVCSVQVAPSGLSQLTLVATRMLTRRVQGEIALTLPSLSFLGLPPSDESGLKIQLRRAPQRPLPPGKDSGGAEGGDDEAAGARAGAGAGDGSGGADGAGAADRSGQRAPLWASDVDRTEGGRPLSQPTDALTAAAATATTGGNGISGSSDNGDSGDSGSGTATTTSPVNAPVNAPAPSALLALSSWSVVVAAQTACVQLYRAAAARMAHAWAWLHALPQRLPQRLHVLQQRLRSRLGQTNLEMLLQPSGPRLGTELEWRHSAQSRSKLAVRVGIAAFSVTLSTERRLSRTSASALGAALQWSQRGLLLKLRISRHSHRLVVPLYLAATPSPTDLLLGCGVPSLLLAVARRGIVRPLRRRAKEHSLRRGREDEAAAREAAAAARRAAFAEARLLTREAASRAREEALRGGLVILGAVYGDVEAALQAAETTGVGRYTPSGTASTAAGGGGTRSEHETDEAANGGAAAAEEGEDGWLADSLGRRWLDVRVPLQFAVSEGVLRLPPMSKATLRGFSAPPAADDHADGDVPPRREAATAASGCQLWIRYQIGAEIRTRRVEDGEALQLGPA